MAKIKLNIKNTQLAQALNLGPAKKQKQAPPEKEPSLEAPQAQPTVGAEEEPRRVKARAKHTPAPKPAVEEEVEMPGAHSAAPTAEETSELLAQETERKQRIAKSRSFLQEEAREEKPEIKDTLSHPVEKIPSSPLPTPIVETTPPEERIKPSSEAPPVKHFEKTTQGYTPRSPSAGERPHYPPRERPPREGGYQGQREGYTPRPPREGYTPRPPREGYTPRPPREGGYTPRPPREGYTPRPPREGYPPSGPRERKPWQPAPSSNEERIKLGPTGRHVKDLIRPRPAYTPGSTDAQGRPRRPATPFKPREEGRGLDTLARQFKKPEAAADTDVRKVKAKEFHDIKPLKKQALKGFDGRDRLGLREGDDGQWRKRRPSKQLRSKQDESLIQRPTSLKVRLPISIKDLASEMKLKASELISKLFMQGVVVTLNDLLDDETTVQLLGQEFGCDIQVDTSEEARIRVTDKTIQEEIAMNTSEDLVIRAPVVTFMGHVDHGKTSLIDAIRQSNRVALEAGAITQHIGAFKCTTNVGDITILDTPGHEAFSAMRSRGASVTDIVVLVIAGDEGMKQQTIEAMNQAKEAGVTIVVALNKSDKPGFNPENVYQQLANHELLPESWGGTTITVNCSAVTKEGIPQLLEMLALQAEVLELRANPQARARGTVLESEMHKGFGPVATILVQNGTLNLGDAVVFGNLYGRVKTMQDERGAHLKDAGPSTPVLITGLSGLPEAGCEFVVVKSEKEAKEIAEARLEGTKRTLLQKKKVSLENLMQQAATGQKKLANIILRADVQGSLEALKSSLLNIRSSKIEVNIISSGVGEISESDIELARASQAFILGFHTQIESHADMMIKQAGVKVYLFDVIYHAIEEIKKMLVDMLDKIPQERELGSAEILTTFKASQLGVIAGCMVQEGSILRNQKVRLVRNGEVIFKGSIASLKRVKEDVKEVKKGLECGILLAGFNDPQPGDIIQSYEIYYLTQEL